MLSILDKDTGILNSYTVSYAFTNAIIRNMAYNVPTNSVGGCSELGGTSLFLFISQLSGSSISASRTFSLTDSAPSSMDCLAAYLLDQNNLYFIVKGMYLGILDATIPSATLKQISPLVGSTTI